MKYSIVTVITERQLWDLGGLALQHYDKAGTGSASPLEPSPTPCDIYCNLRQL